MVSDAKWNTFIGVNRCDKEVISKRKEEYFSQGCRAGGLIGQIASLVLVRKFHTDYFKILLEEAETAFKSGIKYWWNLAK